MLMGISMLPHLENYWTTAHPLIRPGIAEVMSQKRFEQILHYIHLCDSDLQVPHGQPGYDPRFKVRQFLDILSPQLESEYNPHEQLSIDEAMITFKGRLGFIVNTTPCYPATILSYPPCAHARSGLGLLAKPPFQKKKTS